MTAWDLPSGKYIPTYSDSVGDIYYTTATYTTANYTTATTSTYPPNPDYRYIITNDELRGAIGSYPVSKNHETQSKREQECEGETIEKILDLIFDCKEEMEN